LRLKTLNGKWQTLLRDENHHILGTFLHSPGEQSPGVLPPNLLPSPPKLDPYFPDLVREMKLVLGHQFFQLPSPKIGPFEGWDAVRRRFDDVEWTASAGGCVGVVRKCIGNWLRNISPRSRQFHKAWRAMENFGKKATPPTLAGVNSTSHIRFIANKIRILLTTRNVQRPLLQMLYCVLGWLRVDKGFVLTSKLSRWSDPSCSWIQAAPCRTRWGPTTSQLPSSIWNHRVRPLSVCRPPTLLFDGTWSAGSGLMHTPLRASYWGRPRHIPCNPSGLAQCGWPSTPASKPEARIQKNVTVYVYQDIGLRLSRRVITTSRDTRSYCN